jgi:hypothetical protein
MLLVVLDVVAAVRASGVGNGNEKKKGRERDPTGRLCSVKQQRKAADVSKTRDA